MTPIGCNALRVLSGRTPIDTSTAPRLSPYELRVRRGRVHFVPRRPPRDIALTASLCTLLAIAGVVAGEAMRGQHQPPMPVIQVEPKVEPVRAVVQTEEPAAPKRKRRMRP